jgi:hypothetical protein
MANTYFTNLHKKAKILYKTGKYKKYSDAIKAASKTIGAVKILQPGEKKTTKTKKVLVQTKNKKGQFKGYKTMNGINSQIGAIKSGSKYIYHKGIQIEKKPVEISTGGKRKKKSHVYVVVHHGSTVHHTLSDAKKHINHKTK